jgi:hypothetical protein
MVSLAFLLHVALSSLWLPIVLSAVAVFFLAGLAWMVVGHHAKDWVKLPNQDAVMDVLRDQAPNGGQFVFPGCDHKDRKSMNTPEFQAKFAKGPSGYLYIRKPGPFSMGPMFVQSILFYLVVTTLVAHLATATFHEGAPRAYVFHYVWLATWLAYAAGMTWSVIWAGHSWRHTLLCMLDHVVYAAATAGIFAWRWPAA